MLFRDTAYNKGPHCINIVRTIMDTFLHKINFNPARPAAGPPRLIFGMQGCHSSGLFTGAPPLLSPIYISQNPTKNQALTVFAALPPMAAPGPIKVLSISISSNIHENVEKKVSKYVKN